MYTISITSCPDNERIGEYTFYFPVVKIARSHHDIQLPLDDINIGKGILCLKDQPDGVLIWEQYGDFYYSNDKKIAGKKLHRIGDKFGIGSSRFELISHVPPAPDYDVESRYHELTEKHPFMADLFWALKQEMLHIEKKDKQ